MQRNSRTDRTIVAGYSGDDPLAPRMGVSKMIFLPMLIVGLVGSVVIWVVTPMVLLFRG
jgi:hypothetical protein